MVKRVRYHSYEWSILVETGWVTMTVDDGIATMLYHPVVANNYRSR